MHDAPFRRPASSASPTLRALAHHADAARAAEADALARTGPLPAAERDLGHHEALLRRVALGILPNGGWIGVLFLIWLFAGVAAGLAGVSRGGDDAMFAIALFTAVISAAVLFIGTARDRALERREAGALGWADAQPFPVTGYDLWLACDRSAIDVHLARDVDRHDLARALEAVEPRCSHAWIGGVLRLAPPSRPVRFILQWKYSPDDVTTAWVGDARRLHQLFATLLVPLHREVGIERVDLGKRLALSPPPALPAVLGRRHPDDDPT